VGSVRKYLYIALCDDCRRGLCSVGTKDQILNMADRTSISEWTSRHDIIPIEELSPHQQPSTANLTVPVLDLNAKYPEGGAYRNDSTVTETSDLVKSATVVTFEEVKLDRKQPSPVPRDRRWSVHENGSANEPQPQGIYWRSPISMAVFLFFGVMSCVGHHLYYMSWDKEEVGTDSQQQWVLRSVIKPCPHLNQILTCLSRFGTAFAYIVQGEATPQLIILLSPLLPHAQESLEMGELS